MLPALRPGQTVLALRKKRYVVGNVVVFRHEGLEKIKRVYAARQGTYEVRGDNPAHSTDSRQFGSVSASDILGKVIWPRSRPSHKQ